MSAARSRAALARRVLPLIDLTNLDNGCLPADVDRLCAQAIGGPEPVAAVCVWPAFVAHSAAALAESGVRVATVVNFPAGGEVAMATATETAAARAAGADEIDVVIPYRALLRGEDGLVGDVVAATVAAAGDAHVKAILETGELGEAQRIARAARLAIGAGAHFVKTSTGKSAVSATPAAARAMLEVIAESGRPVGLKPSGGIRTLDQAGEYLALADAVMGAGWVSPATFRFGASSLLGDVLAALGE